MSEPTPEETIRDLAQMFHCRAFHGAWDPEGITERFEDCSRYTCRTFASALAALSMEPTVAIGSYAVHAVDCAISEASARHGCTCGAKRRATRVKK